MNGGWLEALSQMAPELAVVVTLLFVILSDLFMGNEPRRLWTQTLLGLAGATVAAVILCGIETPAAGLPPSIRATWICTPLTSLLKAGVLALATLSVAVAYKAMPEASRHAGEFFCLLLFSTLGALFCVSSDDLLMFFVSFELLSLPLYMLCGFRRYDSASAEAGLKYFINGALSSALMLYGISFLYGASGTTNLPLIAERYALLGTISHGFVIGCLLVLVGLGFKVSAAPFHSWAPDVYSGAPPIVSVFLSTAPKLAIIGFTLRLFATHFAGQGAAFNLQADWAVLFVIISIMSMFIGNLSALPQTDVRKILAYSGVAQIGYIFMGLTACTNFNPHPERAISAVLFYALVYGVSNLGAWAVLSLAGREKERYDLTALHGLSQRSPLLAACLALCLMSLAGVPPLSGFVGKFFLFRSIYESKVPFMVVLGVLNSVVSLFYYFKVLKAAYFVEAEERGSSSIALHPVQRLAIQVCLWSNIVLGLWPGLMQTVDRLASTLTQGS